MNRATPTRIGRYRIDGILGEGAMSIIYAGFDPEIQRQVAIKCLHESVVDDVGYRQRFLVEARAAGHLTHPHIVTIFETGETDDGRPYIAMERLPGETLAAYVATYGPPPASAVIELASQLAGALHYAHAQGVIHHDIKPDNIMLVDGLRHAKIADFGIAERGAKRSRSSAQDMIGGTPNYMSPERLQGQPADARSDLFSLGVVLFWLVAGRLPWTYSGDLARLMRQRKRLPEPPIKPHDPATPPVLIDIIRTMLAASVESRYQSGDEIVEDLRLARRSYERSREELPHPRLQSLGIRWASVLGAAVVIVLLSGMLAIYMKQRVAVTGLALDFGSTLGQIIARDAAENIVMGDHAATRALVEDMARNQQIDYLAIADRDGKIIASTQPGEEDQPLPAPSGSAPDVLANDVTSYRLRMGSMHGAQNTRIFDVPIRYQTKTVGALRLGVSEAPLQAAQDTALWVLGLVLLTTLAAVLLTAYWLFRRLRGALDLLVAALLRIARGDHYHRIRLVRHDELGRLFAAFNLMGEALTAHGEGAPENPVAPLERDASMERTELIPVPRSDT
ncbi:serine/threonine protein kinase [Dyella monticola]|uniref:Serine/threonine protein kinase n=1 Tax=Dyella monticola TaxID=1927958 RepID=A0A370X652_9GAMM|nr:serine/threonine-protein kinase [Dyella monticola]RDS83731.1 serine/threonine protein kinase [Dyella monticola]